MSVFALKILAVATMLIDHVCYVSALAGFLAFSSPLYHIGRGVGRAAFLLFAFLLVNGFEKTHDRKRYLARLICFAVLSQLPFSLAFTAANYRGIQPAGFSFDAAATLPLLLPLAVYFVLICERRLTPSLLALAAAFALCGTHLSLGGVCLLAPHMNVFYTLALSLALMLALEAARSPDRSWPGLLVCAAALAVEMWFAQRQADYGLMGAALITGLYLLRGRKPMPLVFSALWSLIMYSTSPYYLCGALAALIPLAVYNGKLGRKWRSAFYLFYPVHLALLGLLSCALVRG